MPDLSICILSWNTRDLTMKCLASIAKNTRRISYEVILVDNGSSDGVASAVSREFLKVKLIVNDKNVGFTKGNNLAIAASTGRYILLLNNDTEIHEHCLDMMVEKMDAEPDTGMACCKMIYPDGSLYLNIHDEFPTWSNVAAERSILTELIPRSPLHNYFHRRYNVTDPGVYETDREICWGLGAFLAVRREVLDEIGPLDERFFIYFEEIDWCKRCRDAGWKVRYFHEPVVMHHTAKSIVQEYPYMTEVWHDSRLKFFAKHYGPVSQAALRILSVPGLIVRLARYRRAAADSVDLHRREEIAAMTSAYRSILRRHLSP